jgi:hypothetical protein
MRHGRGAAARRPNRGLNRPTKEPNRPSREYQRVGEEPSGLSHKPWPFGPKLNNPGESPLTNLAHDFSVTSPSRTWPAIQAGHSLALKLVLVAPMSARLLANLIPATHTPPSSPTTS